ncbi:MAG: sugar kinase [Pseudomonadota bacterium]
MTSKRCRIACVGEAMIELSLQGSGNSAQLGFAGDTLNTAVYLARERPGAHDVSFVTCLGVDPLSERMVAFIEQEGVTAQVGRVADRLPGLYAITTDSAGERSFSYWRENSAARLLFQRAGAADFSALSEYDVVYLSAITLAILPPDIRTALFGWIEGFRNRHGRFAFDSNYRPRLWESPAAARQAVARAWSLCDIALPSLDDEMNLFGDPDQASVLTRLNGYGIGTGALKRGPDGPVPINVPASSGIEYAKAPVVVDTTAAGDSFNGAFLSVYLAGGSIEEAMTAGHNCAVRVIGTNGAIIPRAII